MIRTSWVSVVLVLAGCAVQRPAQAVAEVALASATSLNQAGAQAEHEGDYVRAEQYYASALAAGGDGRAITRALVAVCVHSGRLRSALSYADAELARHPYDVSLRQLVGAIHLSLGDLTRAETELTQALRVRDDAPLAHYTLALVISRDVTRATEARAHFQRYLELAPSGEHRERAAHALAQ